MSENAKIAHDLKNVVQNIIITSEIQAKFLPL